MRREASWLPGLIAGLALTALPAVSTAGVFISINIAPPALPVYVQPSCPQEGYLWTPGYWAYGPAGYYWVPGVWVAPPQVGVLWTPPFWGFEGGIYRFHAGYWGPHVGFYGGINYGFGYGGVGFFGGAWQGGHFAYNTAVTHVNTTIFHNVYNKTVINNTTINNTTVNRTSFNGPGGVNVQPSPQERQAEREQHFQPTQNQVSHERVASADRTQLASANHGRPANLAMARPMARPAAETRPLAANQPNGRGPNGPAQNNQAQNNAAQNNPGGQNHPGGQNNAGGKNNAPRSFAQAEQENRQQNNVNRPPQINRPPQQQPHAQRPEPRPEQRPQAHENREAPHERREGEKK